MHICTIDKCKNTAQIKLVQVIIFWILLSESQFIESSHKFDIGYSFFYAFAPKVF